MPNTLDEEDVVLHFNPGATIIAAGEPGDKMYVIQEGEVRISKIVLGEIHQLAVLSSGEFFGEMGLINNKPRTATATALTSVRVLVVDWNTFKYRINQYGAVAIHMIKTLAQRLDESLDVVKSLQNPSTLPFIYALVDQIESYEGYEDECDLELTLPRNLDRMRQKTGQSHDALKANLIKLRNLGLLSVTNHDHIYIPSSDAIWKYMRNLERIEDAE
ncbi:MAG: cyclic nucleotide-binding domain-containing protein [Myxococcota bacterium]|nr:cyclic nucleotide-binding domain-containing protein [Myxococcota bacterium]